MGLRILERGRMLGEVKGLPVCRHKDRYIFHLRPRVDVFAGCARLLDIICIWSF